MALQEFICIGPKPLAISLCRYTIKHWPNMDLDQTSSYAVVVNRIFEGALELKPYGVEDYEFIQHPQIASLPEEAKAGYAAEIPMKRLGQPEDIAHATAFLLSDQAQFITGVVLPVDGGTEA